MSISQRLYNARTAVWRFPSNKRPVVSADTQALTRIWPDGTWTLPWRHPPHEMDDVVRGVLLQTWTLQERSAVEALRRAPLGGSWSASPIPVDWQVSMAALKQSVPSENRQFLAYVGARLESMGRLQS